MLEHEPSLPYLYRLAEGRLTVRLATARDDLSAVTLLYSDGRDRQIPMVKFATTADSDYYQADLLPRRPTITYLFKLQDGRQVNYFSPQGFTQVPPRKGHFQVNTKDVPLISVPAWAADAIFYQIFPDRFYNADHDTDPQPVTPWGEKPARNSFCGGDLRGITHQLPYLQDMGINALYLNPIFTAPSNHKYDTTDYRQIDPHFGGQPAFRELMRSCRTAGLKVILDGVFNHTGTDFHAFKEAQAKGPASPYWKWYFFEGFPVVMSPKPNYQGWWGHASLPKLNVDNLETRDYLLQTIHYWNQQGIDGWRLDVPNEIAHPFWQEFRQLVKTDNPQGYIVGEIWHDGKPWLQGDQFDAVMNYLWRTAVLDFLVYRRIGPREFASRLAQLRADLPEPVTMVMFNLLGSHDTERILTLARGRVSAVKLAFLFQMTYPGTPVIYYGDEVGLRGGKDPDNRRTMPWDPEQWNRGLRSFVQQVIRLRRDHLVLCTGSFHDVLTDEANLLYVYRRGEGAEAIWVVLNNGDKVQPLSLTVDSKQADWIELLHNIRVKAQGGKLTMVVPRASGLVFKAARALLS